MINTTINQFLTKQLPNLKIAVVGDVMVDRYVFGDVSRISPEAPVPVNRVSKMKEVLGGAGNVASNLSNLDCKVYLGALAGNDVSLVSTVLSYLTMVKVFVRLPY